MAQYGNTDLAFPGLEYGLIPNQASDSGAAQETIQFASPVFAYQSKPELVYGPHVDKATITLSVGMSASNVWSLQIVVTQTSGATLTSALLQITYGTSAKASMDAMVAAINADANMIAAGVSASDNAGGTVLTVAVTPTATVMAGDLSFTTDSITGGTPPTITPAFTTAMYFRGVAVFSQRASRLFGAGTEAYFQNDSIAIKRIGRIWVVTDTSAQDGMLAYPIIGGTNKGMFSASATPSGGYTYPAFGSSPPSGIQPVFRSGYTAITAQGQSVAQNIAGLEVRGIY